MPSRTAAPWLTLVFALACGKAPPTDTNLLIVSFDTVRADRVGAYGNDEWGRSPSPAIDALATRGTLFETVYASRGQTHPSLASMLTGKYPITHGVRENGFPLAPQHTTLMQHLQAAGYRTGTLVANVAVDHPKEGWVARGSDVAVDGYAGRRREEAANEAANQRVWDDRIELAAMKFLDDAAGGGPFALWVHFYDVHKPYVPPAGWRSAYGLGADLPPVLEDPPEGDADNIRLEQFLANLTLGGREPQLGELERIRGLYDGGLSATDERLGRLLGRLADLDLTDRTLVMFTSDHGEELYDHNRYFFHGSSIHDGTVRIPLVLAGPGIAAGRRSSPVARNIDLAPTLLDLLGLAADGEHEGRSLAPLLAAQPTELPPVVAVIEWQDYVYAVSDGRHKLIWNPMHVWPRKAPFAYGPPEAGYRIECLEGYDLLADPTEQRNLLAGMDPAALDLRTGAGVPDALAPLARALRAFLVDPRHQGGYDAGALDEADMEHLRQLGYVGGSADRGDSVKQDPCIAR